MTGPSGMELIINGCEISSDRCGIHFTPYQGNFCNLYKVSLLNCIVKSTYTDKSGAIESSYGAHQLNSVIKEVIGNSDIYVYIEKTYAGNDYTGKTPVTFEYTYKELEVHHIIPLEEDYNKRLDSDNLITLCRYHHELAEKGEISREELQKIIADK